eukprot:CAMPEP_0177616742 /NCGR_PEP_ID=MMETSP0419_2-20121207/24373_1 /TAXON_ID=582737 /ORGANISM="Tetraselmis sp., Strain GSL018" /LENGTH=229 /DNA_ID=CAMNT_0019114931 /DNA_START=86 /DNA_END=776 /DNA_ORIENTATION=-
MLRVNSARERIEAARSPVVSVCSVHTCRLAIQVTAAFVFESSSDPSSKENSSASDQKAHVATPFSRPSVHRKVGADAVAGSLALTAENVDKVLEEVRPYLIADGGNVRVAGVSNGVVMVELQGACDSCPSATSTMRMGIERSLQAAFGDELKQVVQVKREEEPADLASVDAHLDMLRPAITSYGGSCEVLEVSGSTCRVKYEGPKPISQGIRAAIKDKFPTITEVVFEE